jgi:dipeptidyl aminopeptidase/acylaminoacyl peptidase
MRKIPVLLILAILCCFNIPWASCGETGYVSRISIHDLLQDPVIDDVRISPDGTAIAALYNSNDQVMVLIKDLSKENAEPVVINVLNHNVKWVDWASNQRVIAGTLVDKALWKDYYALVVMDKDGKNMRHLLNDFYSIGDIIDFLPDDPDHVLVEELNAENLEFPEVWRVSIGNDRQETRIQPSIFNVDHWLTDANGEVRMGVGYLSDRMIVQAKTSDGDWKTIKNLKYFKDPWFTPLKIGKNGIAYVASTHENDKETLYEYNIDTQTFGAQLFKHDLVDISSAHYSRLKDKIEYVTYTVDHTEIQFMDTELQNDYAAIGKALPDTVNSIVDTSADEKRLIIYAGNSGNTGSYYLFDRDKRQLKYLGSRFPGLEKLKLSKTRGISYAARDGMTLYGYISFPVAYDGKPCPMVVLVHGGPHARDANEYDPWVQFLTNRGYIVFQPNYRGSTGYGDNYWKSGYKQWGLAMEDDIVDGVKILTDKGIVDKDRVCIMGASYGGYAALMGAVRYSDIFRCAISIAGISDLNKFMRVEGSYLNRALIGDDHSDLKAVSPVAHVDDVKIPILLAHGTEDKTVAYNQSDDMYDALKWAKKDVTMIKLKDETHYLEDIKNRVILFEAIDKFLDKNM